ncbi:hypothetical protein [Dokdonia sp. PRO95]|nr:hypothetical protein [Dokdonia sp. PRO95]
MLIESDRLTGVGNYAFAKAYKKTSSIYTILDVLYYYLSYTF